MPVEGYVGLPGSGKTMAAVERALTAAAQGREVWANFRLGWRFEGLMVPCCLFGDESVLPERGHDGCRDDAAPHHEHRWTVYPLTPLALRSKMRHGWRRGRGFVESPRVNIVRSWDELMRLRVRRDVFGRPHVSACDMRACEGCSKGLTVVLDELNLWAPSRLWQKLGIGVLTRWAYVRKDGMEVIWTAQHESRIDKVAREVTDFIWSCNTIGPFKVPFMGWLPVVRRWRFLWFRRRKFIPSLITDKSRANVEEGMSAVAEWSLSRFHQWLADSYDTYEHVASSAHLFADDGEPVGEREAGAVIRRRPSARASRGEGVQAV